MAKTTLMELFTEVKNEKTPVAVENIIKEIEDAVKRVKFAWWHDTIEDRHEVKNSLHKINNNQIKLRTGE